MTHRMPTHRAHTGLYHVVAFIAGREAGRAERQSERREGARDAGEGSGDFGLPGRPKSLERFDRARALRAHAHVYKYTHAHWSTTTGPYHYGSAQDTIYPTGSGLYCFCPRAALA